MAAVDIKLTLALLIVIRLAADQEEAAERYAVALRDEYRASVDWSAVNDTIIDRWSISGLERVKKLAWAQQ